MKKIYILLTRSDTWISKLINLATDDTYTHASISFESGLQPLYIFSRECIHLPLPLACGMSRWTMAFSKNMTPSPVLCMNWKSRMRCTILQRKKLNR